MNDLKRIKRIYENMQDDASKRIYLHRLIYALTGDGKEIDHIVKDEMARYGQDDIMNRLILWIRKKEKEVLTVNVFGAGFAGQQIVHTLQLYGIVVDKIFDNNSGLRGKKIFGCIVESPENIKESDIIVLGVNYHRTEILEQLKKIGVKDENIYKPDGLWWLGKYPQYFEEDIMIPTEHEVFVDGGSLDGGDSIAFSNWCNGKYDAIYAFEPDSSNLNKMRSIQEKIHDFNICDTGLWSKDAELRFLSGDSENCLISDNGNTVVDVTSIDNRLNGQPVTFIKMDIEGSELEAVKGAEKTIKQYKPKLAICVYHKPEDIIDIPQKILEINPSYRFYLRHYSYLYTETVLYAI